MGNNISSYFSTKSVKQKDWAILLIVMLIHVLLALYYKQIVGLAIENNPGGRSWDWWWQTVSIDLLVTDLWRSLWYLHSQPPLFNLYGAFFFNLFPKDPLGVMHFTNIFLGSLISGMIYLILIAVTGKRFLSTVASMVIALDPSLFLFEAYILYDLLTTFLVVATALFLLWYTDTQKVRFVFLFFMTLSILILTRSVYHLVIMPFGLFVIVISSPENYKRALLIGLLVSVIPFAWYAKNQFIFGFFGASSWQGFGLWQVASLNYTPAELDQLVEEGIIPQIVAELEVLRSPSTYAPWGFNEQSDIPVLQQDDRHNINILYVSPLYQDGAVALIKRDPKRYLRAVIYSYKIFNIPGAQFKHHNLNADLIPVHTRLMAEVVQGRWLERYIRYPIGSIFFFLIPLSVLVYVAFLIPLFSAIREGKGLEFLTNRTLDTWLIFLIVYTTLVSIFFEVGENNREKFYIEYLIVVYLVLMLCRIKFQDMIPRRLVSKAKS
jgi:hypothetical protein